MTGDEWDKLFGIVGMLKVVDSDAQTGMKFSIPFQVGDTMTTMGSEEHPPYPVVCTKLSTLKGYECSLWDDGIWRYNRPFDRGRTTASGWDCPTNIVPKYPDGFVHP